MLFGVYPLSLVHARWSVILLCLVQFPSLSSVLTALSFDFHGFHSCSGSSMFPVYLVFRWLVRVGSLVCVLVHLGVLVFPFGLVLVVPYVPFLYDINLSSERTGSP